MKTKNLLYLISSCIVLWAGLWGTMLQAEGEEYRPYIEGQDTSQWILDFQEEFDGEELDDRKFSDVYLPHWSREELVKANYSMGDGKIRLLIDQFQPGWMPNTKQQISSI